MNQATHPTTDPKTREAPLGPTETKNDNPPADLDAMPPRRADDEPHPLEGGAA